MIGYERKNVQRFQTSKGNGIFILGLMSCYYVISLLLKKKKMKKTLHLLIMQSIQGRRPSKGSSTGISAASTRFEDDTAPRPRQWEKTLKTTSKWRETSPASAQFQEGQEAEGTQCTTQADTGVQTAGNSTSQWHAILEEDSNWKQGWRGDSHTTPKVSPNSLNLG